MAGYSSGRGSGYIQPTNWRAIVRRILNRDGHTCYLCSGNATTADHIVPVARGGTHDDDNLAAICEPCHATKTKAEAQHGKKLKARARPQEQHPGMR